MPDETKPYISFYRADFYRRVANCDSRYRQDEQFESSGRNHAFAFYLVATARQNNRTTDDREQRLVRAIEVMRKERGKHIGLNLLHLIPLFIELTLRNSDKTRIRDEIEQIFDASGDSTLRDWYWDVIQSAHANSEALFDRIPYL